MHAIGNIISLLDRLPSALHAAEPAEKAEWSPSFAHCQQHGEYQESRKDEAGVVRWLPMCPKCRSESEVKQLLSVADIPARFASCTFDTYQATSDGQQRALEQCRHYADNFDNYRASGTCLILRGNPGTGKNHLVTAIARELMGNGHSVLRVKAQEFLESYWAKDFSERQQWIRGIAAIDLLILDELGRSSQTKGAEDAFFRLLDARYEAIRPTAILSNLSGDAFRQTLGEAAYDRLRQGGGKLVNFDWSSHRGNGGKAA